MRGMQAPATGHLSATIIEEGLNFFADTAVEELNVAENTEPEFIEVEMTLDTGHGTRS